MVNGQAVVRTFSRGLGDPEAQANLGRLKGEFQQLVTVLTKKSPSGMKGWGIINHQFDFPNYQFIFHFLHFYLPSLLFDFNNIQSAHFFFLVNILIQ